MPEESDRTTTGVVGLDESLQGGYPTGKVLLEGPSSEERNALALSFAAKGLKNGEYVMVVTSTLSPTKVRMVLRKLGVDVKEYEREGKLVIVDWYSHNSSSVSEIEEIGAIIKCPGDTLNLNEAFHKAYAKFPAGSKHRAVVEGLSEIIGHQDLDTAFLLANSLNTTFGDEQSTVLFVVDSEMHNSATMSALEREFDGRIELKRIKGEGSVIGEISIHSMRDVEIPSDNLLLERADDESLQIEGSGVQARELPAEEELADLAQSLKEDSRNETSWFGLGVHYISEKDYDKAQECFNAALKIRPGYVAAWIAKANLYIEQGRNDEALRCYQQALNPGPDNVGEDERPDESEESLEDSGERLCPECGTPVAIMDPFCLSCGMDIPKETPKKKAGSLEEALEACEERIQEDPEEADAWFVKGLCLTRLERYEDAIVALNEATRLNFEYPGLWIVKGKVYSKLGDEKKASLSIQRGIEFARKDVDRAGPTFECSICGEDVSVKADQCPECGARFKPLIEKAEPDEAKPSVLGDELESILKRWETELTELVAPSQKAPPKAPKPDARVLKKRARGTEGLTNGLAREKRDARVTKRAGLTNGVKGRTNGLTNGIRGRTNGLTNGIRGRTNGLTNGIRGRTNGLTNGIRGRTNGLTNGVRGRTNGLTNGLTNGVRGRTNGLTNGVRGRTNGLTNGLRQEPEDLAPGQVNGLGRATGVTNGLAQDIDGLKVSLADGLTNGNGLTNGLGVSRFSRENRLAKWKLYLVPLFALALLVTPAFNAPVPPSPDRVSIDGDFSDWEGIRIVDMDPSGLDPNVDIVAASVEMTEGSVFLYLEVLGNMLGGNLISETGDAVHILIDSDRDYATGYQMRGLGVDHYVEITGVGGEIRSSSLQEFPVYEDHNNWNGWTNPRKVQSAASASELEVRINKEDIDAGLESPLILFHALSSTGDWDYADYVLSESTGILSVLQQSALVSDTVQGQDQSLLNIELSATNGQVTLSSIDLEVKGSIQSSEISSLKLVDTQNQLLDQVIFFANPVTFEFDPLVIEESISVNLVVRADIAGGGGKTIGAEIPSSSSFGIEDAAATLTYVSSQHDLAYVSSVPQQVTIDGGFVDWVNFIDLDETGEGSTQGDTDIDIEGFDNALSQGRLFTYFDVTGKILAGTGVPRKSPKIRQLVQSLPDSDRDAVPDQYDPYPLDFNNDGEPDVQTSSDRDGDGSIDYPYGMDYWLNTTIPSDFPAPYAYVNVSRYIGPVQKPELIGEDVARIFIDSDNSTSTGYYVEGTGSDYMLEIRGTNGELRYAGLMEFVGSYPGEWNWDHLGVDVDVAYDSRRLEASLDVSTIQLQPDYLVTFMTSAWKGGSDITDGSANRGPSTQETRHYADANGGYGLVAPDGATIDITLDGTIDEANELDWVSIAKTDTYGSYIKTYVVYNSSNLYVAVEVLAEPGSGNTADYAELAFDSGHDGGTSPDTNDYKFRATRPNGNVVKEDYVGTGSGWDDTWSSSLWDAQGAATDTYVTFEFWINNSYVFGTDFPSDGDISGFCVHVYNHSGTDYYYWPDETGDGTSSGREDTPDDWGDLFYTKPRLVINEVSPLTTDEWVELYNGGDSIDINGIVLSDQDGFTWKRGSSLVVPNDVYVILMEGSGSDDTDFSDGNGTLYIGTTEFTDAGDDVLLKYGGNDMGFDYMQYGSGGDIESCPSDPASENTWSGTLTVPGGTDTAGRDKTSSDTNDTSDWDNDGGPDVNQPTRGHVNYLSQLTVSGSDEAPSTIYQGQIGVVMLRLTLSADYGWVQVTGLDVNRTGTSTVESDLSEVTLWDDTDEDGNFDSGTDTFLAVGSYIDGNYTFSGISVYVQNANPEYLLVVYNVSESSNTGVTVGARVDGEDNVTVSNLDTVASFSAIQSTNSTISSNVLSVYGGDIADAVVFRTEDFAEMLNITLSVPYGSVTVTQIEITKTGTSSLEADIDAAILYDDVNGDGDYDAGTDTYLATGSYSGGVYTFSGLSIVVSAGIDEYLLVMYNISSTATLGDTVGAKITGASDITVESPDTVAAFSEIASTNAIIRDSDVFVIETTGEVYESTDGGKTFIYQGDASQDFVAICSNRSNNDLYAFVNNGSVYRSTDNGQTWLHLSDAFGGSANGIDLTIDISDYIYLVRSAGKVYRSTDNGATFIYQGDTGTAIGIEANYSNGDLYVIDPNGGIHYSSDSGQTWTTRGDASSDTDVEDISIDSSNNIYVLEGSGEIYRSTDYGNTFSQLSDIGADTYVGICIDRTYDYIYVIASNGQVYMSIDGGSNWILRSDIGSETDYQDITCFVIPEFSLIVLPLFFILILIAIGRRSRSGRKRHRMDRISFLQD